MWVIVQAYPLPVYGGRPDQGLPGYGHPDQGLPGYPVDPGWGGGWGGGGRPDQGLPGGGGHPGNWVPGSWGGRPDQGLPGYGHPGNRPPGSGLPPMPGQGLPPDWGLRPDQGLPGSQPGIDNTLPGRPDYGTGQPIVPGATPHGTAIATAPPEKVNAEEGAWVLVSVHGALVWAWAQKPQAPATPGNELPGGAPARPDQGLPAGGAQPKK